MSPRLAPFPPRLRVSSQTTCTVAKALNVTFFGNSVLLEPRVLMTGFSGGRGLAVSKPAEVARSRSFCDMPVLVDLFDGAITCGSVVGVMYLRCEGERKQKQTD